MTFPDPLLTKADIAGLLRCCERTIERQVREGAFPPPERFGKESLWFQSVIHAWLNRRRESQLRWVENTVVLIGDMAASPIAAGAPATAIPQKVDSKSPPVVRASRTKGRPPDVLSNSVFSEKQLERTRCGD
jgi:predicted DNA-binding transcriptional regulator AlpA